MSALRFPKADGAMIVVTEQVHASATYTRTVRISVRHIICYYPHPHESGRPSIATTMQLEGRAQPIRVLHAPEELDQLIAACDQTDAPLACDRTTDSAASG